MIRCICWMLAASCGLLSGCQLFRLTPRTNPFYGVVLQQFPDNTSVLYLQGRVFFNEGQFAAAADKFQRYTQRVAQDARGWMALGRCEMELSDFASAERNFRRATALKPDATVASGLVSAVLMQGRVEEARKMLADAQARYGKTAALSRAQGDIALMAGQAADALQAYEDSLAQNPGQPDLRDRVRDLRDFLTNGP